MAAKRRRPWRTIATAVATVAAIVVGSFVVAASAQAVSYTFVIDSLDGTVTASDTNPGDGVCRTAAGTCTLLAAIQESNALNAPAGAVTITAAPGWGGNIDPTIASRMQDRPVSNQDAGAHYEITAPVTIDLRGLVTVETSRDTIFALFHVNAPNVTFLNMNQILSGESTFVLGPNADGFVLDGGSVVTQNNYFPERFMTIREGAQNITVRNYRIQGFAHIDGVTAIFYINAQNSTPIRNVKIENVDVTYSTGPGGCGVSDGSGCRTNLLDFVPRGPNVVVDGFEFTNSSVTNLPTTVRGFAFSTTDAPGFSVNASNITISDNRFINVQGAPWYGVVHPSAFISLPYGPMGGTNRISGNEFVRGTVGQQNAIRWNGNTPVGNAGDLTIADNYFDGYNMASIGLVNTGTVTVERNAFGARSASQARPATSEETLSGDARGIAALLSNGTNANGRMNTWYPTGAATVMTTDAPAGAVSAVSPLPQGTPLCLASVPVREPDAAPFPVGAVDLDVYWTADRTAEVYLGRASAVTGSSTTLQFPIPVGPQEFPTTAVGGTQQITMVDQTTGVAGGYIRVQTQASGASSQYSRIVALSGSCRPEVTITQAAGQNDPTLARDLHFRVSSTLPLDAASVSVSAVQMAADAVDATIDAERLNPRTVSVTPVAGSANREFDVIARVDDSARVTASIPAETVRSLGGLTNRDPASGDDHTIVFQNPVVVRPAGFTLVTGDTAGQQYAFSLRPGAPQTTAPLTFDSTLDAAGVEHGVSLSTAQTHIAAGATASEHVRVTAAAGEVASNTPVVISSTLSSADSNFDQLVVAPITARLFSTDPSVRIVKRAFTGSTDTSSPERIMATGTELLSGSRATDGQAICFVYTVTNTSSDDWATVLTDVTVRDSDRRLGSGGVIGVVPRLEIGASVQLSACATLIPVDTTVGGVG